MKNNCSNLLYAVQIFNNVDNDNPTTPTFSNNVNSNFINWFTYVASVEHVKTYSRIEKLNSFCKGC